jgi:hypothetical protein
MPFTRREFLKLAFNLVGLPKLSNGFNGVEKNGRGRLLLRISLKDNWILL